MEQTGTVKLAKVLKVLVTIVFICNLIVLPLVPGVVSLGVNGIAQLAAYDWDDLIGNMVACLASVWQVEYEAVLTGFLLFCGVCTAVTLWQAKGVLGTVIRGNTFTFPNARRMRIAAICMFLISGAALCRMLWEFSIFRTIQPIFTYNALFIPIFTMGGLLCMVMSALFRQAAELKEENDLTI